MDEQQERGKKRENVSPVGSDQSIPKSQWSTKPEFQASKRVHCCRTPQIRATADAVRCLTCGRSALTTADLESPLSSSLALNERTLLENDDVEYRQHDIRDAESISDSVTLSLGLSDKFSKLEASFEFATLQTNKKEIRLLVLEPGTAEQPVSFSIVHAALASQEPPEYEAISYTWADENGEYKYTRVRCDTQEVSVTENCEAVLRRLRLDRHQRRVWIDQLCINQSDLTERGHQVGLMPEIYSRASAVLIFLGENTDYAGLVFSSANDFAAKQSTGPRCDSGQAINSAPPSWSPFLNDSVCRLLTCPWFTRVWVLQEVARASKAYLLGSKASVSWGEFRAFIDSWHAELQALAFQDLTVGGQVTIPSKLPGALNINLRHSAPPHELLDLLVRANDCNAGDPRDKVFALYGIVLDARRHGLVADYRKSPEQVFIETAWFTIRELNTLKALSYATGGSRPSMKLPSWVPDWSTNRGHPLNQHLQNIDEGNWSSAFHTAKSMCIGDSQFSDPNETNTVVLPARGRCLGSIAKLLPPESGGRRPSRGSQLPPNLQSCLRCAVKLGAVIGWAQSRHHVVHTESSAGFSMNRANVGDQIWQFDGADVLFVCRATHNGVALVSECYLWGFSYHECFQWDPCKADEAVGCNHCSGFRHTPIMSTLLH